MRVKRVGERFEGQKVWVVLIRWWNALVVSGSLWRIGGLSSSLAFPLPDREGQETSRSGNR